MKHIGWIALVIIGVGVVYNLTWTTEVVFANLSDAKTALRAAGFICTPDCISGDLGSGFVVSRQDMPRSQIYKLLKCGPMSSAWKGKVWAHHNSNVCRLATIPDNAGARQWGEILIFGDPDFLDEVEDALQHTRS
jgi:hypothetical protein